MTAGKEGRGLKASRGETASNEGMPAGCSGPKGNRSTLMAELGDVKMAEDSGLAETICPSRGERAVFRRLGNTSSSREMSSAGGTRIVCARRVQICCHAAAVDKTDAC